MARYVAPGNIPEDPLNTVVFERFRGVDLTSAGVNVDKSRSPNAPNIMPDDDGFPVKRPGYATLLQLGGPVYGAYTLEKDGERHDLIHAGAVLYRKDGTELHAGMNEEDSSAVQLGGKLWILDGKEYLCFDGEEVKPVSAVATVPVITVSKAPNGETGATSYQPINLLTGKRTDSFLGTAAETVYVLSFGDLSPAPVTAQILDSAGIWQDRAEGAAFAVDRAAGKVTFSTAPGAPPVTGEDNVRITYEVAESQAGKINLCRFCILYGVRGMLDRVFMSGSPEEPNVDYWSEFNDPAYMGDIYYSILGQESSPIMGYSVLNDKLVTHKRGEENERNAFIRGGDLDENGDALFPVSNVLQGDGPISMQTFASLNGEPLFLTGRGVYAMTPSDITGERYMQNRSYYINGELLGRGDLPQAHAVVWGQFYALALDGRMYLLDGEQKTYEKQAPYSTYQYEGYFWVGFDARRLWVWEDVLYFGTDGGRVAYFLPNRGRARENYNDDGAPITARWETPDMSGDLFFKKKSFRFLSVRLAAAPITSVKIYARVKGFWNLIKSEDKKARYFQWSAWDWGKFSWSGDSTPRYISTKLRIKKVDKVRFAFENGELDEPFGLLDVGVQYRETGNLK